MRYQLRVLLRGAWSALEAYDDLSAATAAADSVYAGTPEAYVIVVDNTTGTTVYTAGTDTGGGGGGQTGTGETVPPPVKDSEFQRIWHAYEPLWVCMIAGVACAVAAVIILRWYQGVPVRA